MKYIEDLSQEQEEYYFLELSLTQQLYNKYLKEVNKQIEKNKDENNHLLEALILLMSSVGDVLNIDTNQISKLEKQLNKEIDKVIQKQMKDEISNIEKIVKEVIKEEFKINNYLQKIGLEDFQIQNITEKEIMEIIDFKINDKTFKDRIEDNKKNISNMLSSAISLFLLGDITTEKVINELSKNLNLNNYMTSRLGTHEVMRCLTGASELWKEKAGITKEIYCSVLEKNTCQLCMRLHGTIYDVADTSKPNIPLHVHCKCKYITIPNNLWKNFTDGQIKLQDILKGE